MNYQNHKSAAVSVIRDRYRNLLIQLKSYLIISYAVMLPLFFIQFLVPISFEKSGSFSWPLALVLLTAGILLILFAIFLYRLFSLDKNRIFKVTMIDLLNMLMKSFLYSLALGAVFILTYFILGLLFGLILSIINSAAESELLSGESLADVISYTIMLFMLLVFSRIQPTFISIALGHKTIEMKSAYYYTRDNNKNLLLIALSCYLLFFVISGLLTVFNSYTNAATNSVISFILSPLNMLPVALQLSAGCIIYKKMVMDMTVQHD